MNIRDCFTLICLIFSQISCWDSNFEYKNEVITGDLLPVSVITEFNKYNILNPKGLVKSGDVITIANPANPYHFDIINLKTNEQNGWLKSGIQENEAIYASNLSFSKDGITTLDFSSGQFYEYDTHVKSRAITKPLQLSRQSQHLVAVKGDNFILSTGLYEQGRYRLFSLENNREDYFLSYPEHPEYPNLSEKEKSILYASSVLRLRPDNRAFVSSDIRSGILDICRIDGNMIQRIALHCLHFPKIKLQENNIIYYEDNVNGFRDIAVSNEYIYVLYSGKTYKEFKQNVSKCNTLFVFDWNGNLINTYSFTNPTTYISYDLTENELYGISYMPNASLVKFNL